MLPISSAFPVKGFQPVTWAIIGLCVLVSCIQLVVSAQMPDGMFYQRYGAHPALVIFDLWPWNPDSPAIAWSTVSSMFVHAGFLHLLFNMLFFHCFSEPMEVLMGSVRYAIFYLLCGLAGAVVYCTIDPASFTALVGASGAVTGVLAAHTLLLPYTQIRVGINATLPAWGFTAFWVFLQFLGAADSESTTAYGAHFGGGIAGLMLAPLFVKNGVQILARPVEDTEHALEYDEGFVVPRIVAAGVALLLVVTLGSFVSGRRDSVDAAGKIDAEEWVAVARLEGVGVPQDTGRGLALYRTLAAQDAKVATRLADILHEGKTAPKDDAEAAKWYERAAERKEPRAISIYAQMLVDGSGVPRDRARGLALLQQLADSGYSSAALKLGQILESGRGDAAPDLAGAVRSYKQGCDNAITDKPQRTGRIDACRHYARMLKDGSGIQADPEKAAAILKQLEMDRLFDAGVDAILNRRR